MNTVDPLDGCSPDIVRHEVKAGKFIFLRALDGAGRDAYINLASKSENGLVSAGDIAALGIVRSETDSTLAYVSEDQKALLKTKDGEILKDIALKIMQISGLRPKDAEEAEKKS